jgi:hypothetical protein
MLDNAGPETLGPDALALKAKFPNAIVEASGGITLDTIAAFMHPAVDVISNASAWIVCPAFPPAPALCHILLWLPSPAAMRWHGLAVGSEDNRRLLAALEPHTCQSRTGELQPVCTVNFRGQPDIRPQAPARICRLCPPMHHHWPLILVRQSWMACRRATRPTIPSTLASSKGPALAMDDVLLSDIVQPHVHDVHG